MYFNISDCIFRFFLRTKSSKKKRLPKRSYNTRTKDIFDESQDCAKRNSKSFSSRIKNYPFNLTAKIQLVSFKHNPDTANFGEYTRDSLPKLNDTVCYSKLFEVKTLSLTQIDKLTDLMYNYGFKFIPKIKGNVYLIGSVLQCYNPRNAILFLDKDNKVFEFIEICFECKRIRTSSDSIGIGVKCNQKLKMIQNFFKEVGIDYGITERL